MKCKGIIFDFNGVLLWDSHLHERAWNACAKEIRGLPFTEEEIFGVVHGRTNKLVFEYLLKRTLTDVEAIALSDQKETIYRTLCLENREDFQLSPGAIELLDHLVAKDIPHTIATASGKENLDFFIKHLELQNWFDLTQIVYDDGTYDGKQRMFSQAAKNLSLEPYHCMVIEDSKSGIVAASAAKIGKIIGLGPEMSHPHLKELEGVSEVITSLCQIDKKSFQSSN